MTVSTNLIIPNVLKGFQINLVSGLYCKWNAETGEGDEAIPRDYD